MLEIIFVIAFIWLLIKAIGFALRLTWGVTKIIASILMALAMPLLVVCLIFAGGIALIVPVAMIAIAAGILKTCV